MKNKEGKAEKISAEKDIISVTEAARVLSLEVAVIRRWLDLGLVKTYKQPSGKLRVRKKEVLSFASKLGLNPLSKRKEVPPDVLIVDDDVDVVRWLKLFMKENYPLLKIDSAENGFEAGIKLSYAAPIFVLLDLRMPGVDGIEVCRIIKNKLKLKNTRVIGMTVSQVKIELNDFRRSGVEDILFKPLLPEELKERIGNLLEGVV